MFSFLTERPRSAHKALQDAFAYLIVLKHKARAGELGWELANDFDEHKEVWTSIRDLIKAHIFEAFGKVNKISMPVLRMHQRTYSGMSIRLR